MIQREAPGGGRRKLSKATARKMQYLSHYKFRQTLINKSKLYKGRGAR